jgi:hypothetical protein
LVHWFHQDHQDLLQAPCTPPHFFSFRLPPSLSFSPNVVSNSTLKLCFLRLVNAELKRTWKN